MCNLSEGIFEKGRSEGEVIGRDKEKQDTVLRLFRKGRDLSAIVDATDWTLDQVKKFLRSKNLQPAQ